MAYCLKHYIRSYGGEVLGRAGSLARCRELPCPRRQAQALTQACARTRMSVHTQGVTQPLPPPQRIDFAPQHPHLPRAERGWSIAGTSQGLSGQRCSLSPAPNRGAAVPLHRDRMVVSRAVAQVLPSPAEERSAHREVRHCHRPGRKGSDLKGAARYHLPAAGSRSRQRLRGVKRALQSSTASPGAIFLVVLEKMRRNDMGNVRNKARSN